jgi:recombination protein RecR
MPHSIIQRLTEHFIKFPGIGPRQARRFVYYLLQAEGVTVEKLLQDIKELRRVISRCGECYRFYPLAAVNKKNSPVCDLCQDNSRDQTVLMLVEKDIDLESVEKAGVYRGHYFILGGLVPILDTRPASRFRAKELLEKIQKQVKSHGLKEIIIALSANREGDNTVEFLKKFLEPAVTKYHLRLSVLGRGLSTGTELEYSDSETLKSALKNRG